MFSTVSNSYLERVVDPIVAEKLSGSGGVIIEGPKACGKTATAMRHAHTVHFVDTDDAFRQLFSLDPALALEGNTPILLDEWQVELPLWDHVRRQIDLRQAPGQFILSGSAMPAEEQKGHSGVGRFARVRMRPMTGLERGVFSGGVSLNRILHGEQISPYKVEKLSVPELIEVMVHGGWPADHDATLRSARSHVADYVDRMASYDVFDAAGSRIRRPLGVRALMRSLARNVGQAPSLSTLVADVSASDGLVDRGTVARWLEALQRLFFVEAVDAWYPQLRSKATIRTSPVFYLADSSLSAFLLGANDKNLLDDLETAGFIFENYAYQQLVVYAEALGGQVMHYRDSNGKEFDSVIVLEDGSWAGVEVKLGASRIPAGIDSLISTAHSIDVSVLGEPRALILIVGSAELAYTDPATHVHVIPIRALQA